MNILYEDNHIIAINKAVGEIVQGDKTGDEPLLERVKAYIQSKYNKPGAVYLGLPHRLDRPTSGVVLFARTSKALTRLNDMFKDHTTIRKTYWALVEKAPQPSEGRLEHYLLRKEAQNKSFVVKAGTKDSKQAILTYRTLAQLTHYTLVEVNLLTGRHHQIRCQLAAIGCPIKGDLKYGAKRSNPDGGISLHARAIEFVHPVGKDKGQTTKDKGQTGEALTKELIRIVAPVPTDPLWQAAEKTVETYSHSVSPK